MTRPIAHNRPIVRRLYRMGASYVALATVFVISSAVCACACETNGRGVLLGGTVGMQMTAGETCAYTFASPGSSFGLGGTATTRSIGATIKNVKIAARPAHGQAGRAGLNSIAYKPAPSYHGSDSFQVEIELEGRTITVPFTVSVN